MRDAPRHHLACLFTVASGNLPQQRRVRPDHAPCDVVRANIDALQGLVHAEAAAAVLAGTIGHRAVQRLLTDASRRAAQTHVPLQTTVAALVADEARLRWSVDSATLRDALDPLLAMAPATAHLRHRLPAALASHNHIVSWTTTSLI